ncbi:sigma-70 family RNA polymerase sigma factor [Paenibacillus odorifer]|uniref:RNA polymerase sigma-70 domain-containing protein n=1 Tax=Paenibacillus odorifer TaxID=189426 RepID=A0A1R0Y9G7_9BACL|nr:RNA polymerase sigma factor RpoD/SigA [Paenibacillus odorifer]OMD44045.1 hypothetical protein BSK52_00395 [Paenibacillus odorifer]
MIPHSLIEKLNEFEKKFPDKTYIKLLNAKNYISEAIGKDVSAEHIKSYLIAKGYQEIDDNISSPNDELNLDDILNMDWSKKRNYQPSVESQGTLNSYYLNELSFGDNTIGFERLVVENQKLVQKIAARYQNYINHQLSYDDLVSEGTIGLISAIHKFDINKEVQFSTYAVWWIRQKIIRAIIDTGTTIRIPVYMFESVVKIKRAELACLLNDQRPNVAELCSDLDINEETYKKAKIVEHQFLGITSLDQYASTEEQDTEIGDFVSIESHKVLGGYHKEFFNPSLLSEQRDVRDRIRQIILEHLKPREQEIIFERFGFYDNEPKTLEHIGQSLGLTRERIRQIEAKALRKLRARITRKEVIHDYQWPEQIIGG